MMGRWWVWGDGMGSVGWWGGGQWGHDRNGVIEVVGDGVVVDVG